MNPGKNKTIAIVGAGLGGLSAAISLACEGYKVSVFEKNDKPGGKLNRLEKDGFKFDLGPSILTLPQYFEALFLKCNKQMSDYVNIVPVRPHWRNFFEDGTILDLHPDMADMKKELEKLGDANKLLEQLERFLRYSKEQYDLVERGYFSKGLDGLWDFIRYYGFWTLTKKMDHKRRMDEAIADYFTEPHLKSIFEYFIKYVGSSAKNAPGFMNLMPNIQFEFDLWYVKGGMYNLAIALEKLAKEQGVAFYYGSEIASLEKTHHHISGVKLNNGQFVKSDYVVSNMEVIPTYKHLLKEDDRFLKKLEKFEPACSGLVVHLGVKKIYPQLRHHCFFFSKDQSKHFETVFDKRQLPEDPTIYLVAPSRTDPSVAPEGCDNIKILPHIPYIDDDRPISQEAYMAFKDRIIDKLERMGLEGLRENTIVEDIWTPYDIRNRYYSNKGSIYGVVTDWQKNYAFKAPKKSTRYHNLFFVGGSVNPGGGMPMVVLCGQNVANEILQMDRQA